MTRSFSPHFPTNQLTAPVTGIAGRLVEGEFYVVQHRTSEGATKSGLMLVPGTDPREQALHPPENPTDAAGVWDDNDAIKTTFNSSASAQTFVAADFNGVIGAGRIGPARAITFTATANAAQFGAVEIEVIGYDPSGNPVRDVIRYDGSTLATPFPTSIPFSGPVQVFIPAGAGATGEGELGVGDQVVGYGKADILGMNCAFAETTKEVAQAAGYDHDDMTGLNVVQIGVVEATVEATAATAVVYGAEVWMRYKEVGTDLRGQLTGPQAPGGNYAKLYGARWEYDAAAGENSFIRANWW